ncbi:MAG: hypothetical protein WC736_14965 [Gallionella sp.]|jgi:hypothetical protein
MASKSLGTLTLDLVAKIGGFEQGMDKAARTSAKRMKEIQRNVEKAGKIIGASLVAGATGLLLFVDRQAEAIAKFQELSEKAGDSASKFASLKLASDVSGVSLDQVAAASIKLTAALSKLDDEGKGAGLAIKAIGIDFDDFKKLSPVEQLDAVSKALAGFKDGAAKTAVAVQLFGKAGAEILPFLNDLAEYGRENVKLTDEQIKAADTYTESVSALRSQIESLAQTQVSDLLPIQTQLVTILTEAVRYTAGLSKESGLLEAAMGGLRNVLQTVVVLGSDVAFVFGGVGREIGAISAQLSRLAVWDFSGFKAISEAVKEDGRIARAELDKFQQTILNPSGSTLIKKGQDNRPTLNFSGISDAGAKKESDALKQLMKDEAQYFETRFDDEVKLTDATKSQMEAADQLRLSLRSVWEVYDDEVSKINGMPYLTAETRTRALSKATEDLLDGLDALDPTVEKASKELNDFAKQAAANITDAFADFLFDPFAEGLDGMIRGFADALQRMAANAAAAQIGQYIFGTQDKSGNLVGGLIQAGIGYFAGGTSGSTAAAASPGNMNFSIPESVGGGSIPVMPKVAASSTSKGLVINQNFAIQAPQGTVSRQTQNQIATNAAKAASNALRRRNA